jgi:hypothetical protein
MCRKISAEKQNEGPRIEIVTRRGDRTWDDIMNQGN